MNNRFIFVILLGLLCTLSGHAQDKMGGADLPTHLGGSASLEPSCVDELPQ